MQMERSCEGRLCTVQEGDNIYNMYNDQRKMRYYVRRGIDSAEEDRSASLYIELEYNTFVGLSRWPR